MPSFNQALMENLLNVGGRRCQGNERIDSGTDRRFVGMVEISDQIRDLAVVSHVRMGDPK